LPTLPENIIATLAKSAASGEVIVEDGSAPRCVDEACPVTLSWKY
jgi:hypothetical protein